MVPRALPYSCMSSSTKLRLYALVAALNGCPPVQGGCTDCEVGKFSIATGADAGVCKQCLGNNACSTIEFYNEDQDACVASRTVDTDPSSAACQSCTAAAACEGSQYYTTENDPCQELGAVADTPPDVGVACRVCEGASACQAGTYYVAAADECLQPNATADTK
jgi:hypothetical protein